MGIRPESTRVCQSELLYVLCCFWVHWLWFCASLMSPCHPCCCRGASTRAHRWVIGYVCHELRNPLHVLKSTLACLIDEACGPSKPCGGSDALRILDAPYTSADNASSVSIGRMSTARCNSQQYFPLICQHLADRNSPQPHCSALYLALTPFSACIGCDACRTLYC